MLYSFIRYTYIKMKMYKNTNKKHLIFSMVKTAGNGKNIDFRKGSVL